MSVKIAFLQIGEIALPVKFRRSGMARRISLRLNHADRNAVLVLPPGASESQALAFARSRSEWLAARFAALPPRIPFEPEGVFPLLGDEHKLIPAPIGQRGIQMRDGTIAVPGQPEHFARRVRDWLVKRARAEIEQHAIPMAERLGHRIARIRINDPKARWGSCNSQGALSFSWRLVMTPPPVLAYVVAHEVAHLAELNHSPAFWKLVETLSPASKSAKAWLKQHGQKLHFYG